MTPDNDDYLALFNTQSQAAESFILLKVCIKAVKFAFQKGRDGFQWDDPV